MANLNGNKHGEHASDHVALHEEFDVDSFFLTDAANLRLGGRPPLGAAERNRGVNSAMAKAIRDYAIDNKLACFKIRSNQREGIDAIIAGGLRQAAH